MSATTRPLRIRAVAAVCALAGSAALVTACGKDEVTHAGAVAAAQAIPSPPFTRDQADRKALVPAAGVSWDKAAATAVAEVPQGRLAGIEPERPGTRRGTGSPGPGTPDPFVPSPVTPTPGSPSPGSPTPGTPVWTAEVAAPDGTVRTVLVNAVTGRVAQSQAGPDQDADDERELTGRLDRAQQTPQRAAATATGKKKGTVTAVRLDEDDAGTLIRSVDVVTPEDWYKTTFEIDAVSGKILRERVGRD
ncbi:PepSY domain-containing protein [Streptomyces sp. NRRL S-118]|uniref:PepSY domain-containing protein n=1 Tax=Streptomyces sp. NRRL S-118 TaxID=1463881 RepID=UPI0004CB5D65|nr:PepSY domain-containing protein [Streptomyces sp. NRRL S-118]